ncbi:MAG: Mycothiol maleylpyruvate isomerase N-terminal domain protein [Nocardioidaceae bacterium]|nr:Mycothiol maleylpyruvate isomerase N-terminal domain protein [Nocardioidaceae bacterium]
MTQPPIDPDTKDWTWVLERPCPDCGFDASLVDLADLPRRLQGNAVAWASRLTDDTATERPSPGVWSPLEYACHVRDVHRVFDERVRLMLEQDEPRFANWDQDATALDSDYASQTPVTVAGELAEAADAVGERYAGVPDDAWQRRGLRSNGSEFTIDTLARYHLHDVVHHAYDVDLENPA